MKKSTLLISGMLILGTSAGLTTLALNGNLPQYAANEEEEPIQVSYDLPLSFTTPAQNAKVLSSDNLSELRFTFSGGGDDGLEVLDRTPTVQLLKDGALYETIDLSNTSKAYIDRNYVSTLIIKLDKPLTEPGTYSITVPQGVVGFTGFTSDGTVSQANSDVTLTFDVIFAMNYSFTPGAGEVTAELLRTPQISYADGASIALNSSATKKVGLYLYDESAGYDANENPLPKDRLIGEYSLSVDGNKVNLSLPEEVEIPVLTKAISITYYHIVVPSDLWNVTLGDKTLANPEFMIGNYSVRAFTAGLFSTRPEVGTEEPVNYTDFNKFALQYAGKLLPGNATAKVEIKIQDYTMQTNGTLKTSALRTILQYNDPTISESGRIASYGSPLPGTTTYINSPEALITSDKYQVVIGKGAFTDASGTSNNAITLGKTLNVKGVDYNPLFSLQVNSSAYTQGDAVAKMSKAVGFKWVYNSRVKNPDAKIIVKKNGTVVKELKASETSTAAAKATGAGTQTANFNILTADDNEVNSEYEISIEADAFAPIIAPELGNKAMTFKVMVNPSNPDYAVSPQRWTATDPQTVDEISEITLTYPEGVTVERNTAKTVSVSFGTISTKNFAGTSTTVGSFDIPSAVKEIICEGNKVTFKITNPVAKFTTPDYIIALLVPANAYFITENGRTVPNNAQRIGFKISKVKTPELLYNVEGTPITATTIINANDIVGTSITTAPNILDLQFAQSVFGAAGGNIDLLNEAGEYVTTFYKATSPKDSKQNNLGLFLKQDNLTKIPEGVGKYTIKIPAETLLMGNSNAESVLAFYNADEFLLPITLANYKNVAGSEVFQFATTEITNLNCFGASAGRPMAMAAFEVKVPEGLGINKESTAKVELKYHDAITNEDVLIGSISAEEGIDLGGVAAAADEVIELPHTNTLRFFFVNGDVPESFQKEGQYTLVIPNDLFTLNNGFQKVDGANIALTYAIEAQAEFEYTITPAEGTEFNGKIDDIVLTFPGKAVSYDAAPGKLYGPDGVQIKLKSSYPTLVTNGIKWILEGPKNTPIEWVDGSYTFKILKNTVYVGIDDTLPEGNWPNEDFAVTYVVKNNSTGVAIIGIEAADAYTVYTLDGKAMLLNAPAEKLIDLPNGLYIINGKKAIIRK